ncbi:MAG TPA: glycosyltransferase family 39 protein [Gemmatimonadales bacterium]
MVVLVPELRRLREFAVGPIAALAAAKLALHLWVNAVSPYGFHRDEFLYLAMGRHLRLWSMDFPPGIALLAEAGRATLGDSLVAIRLAPALAGALLVVAAALFARELGGGGRAQVLAALAVLASPLFLRSANLFQPVVFDQVTWSAALLALTRLSWRPDPRWWIALGLALGLGVLVKFSIAFVGLGIAAAILLTPLRRSLLTPWPWSALALALAVGSPSLVGQWTLGFPVVGQMADLREGQLERVTAAAFFAGQLLWGPTTLLAAGGLAALLAAGRFRRYRALGWACAATLLVLLLLRGKAYYAGPIYPALFGAGAVPLERTRLRWAVAAAVLAFGGAVLPLGVPILPPERMAAYVEAIGATAALRTNTGELERLPQDYADMLGWEEQVGAVARVYHGLPEADRTRAVLLAGNYGEAGAIDFFGPRHGLPRAVSPAGSYWFFGPGEKPGDVVVTIGIAREDLRPFFDSLQAATRVTSEWAVAEERDLTVFVAREPRGTLQEVWPTLAGRN